MFLDITTIIDTVKTGGFIRDDDIKNGHYKPGSKDDLRKGVVLVEQHKIEDLPEKYQEKVNEKLLTETIGGRKGTHEEVKQRLVDEYYYQWQQEQNNEEQKKENQKYAKQGDKNSNPNINNEANQEFIESQVKQNTKLKRAVPIVKPYKKAPFEELTSYDKKILNNTRTRIKKININRQLEASKKALNDFY